MSEVEHWRELPNGRVEFTIGGCGRRIDASRKQGRIAATSVQLQLPSLGAAAAQRSLLLAHFEVVRLSARVRYWHL